MPAFNIKEKFISSIRLTLTVITILYLHLGTQSLFIIREKYTGRTAFIIIFNILTFFVYTYFFMVAFNRGYINGNKNDEYLFTKTMQYKKYCYRCRSARPERSHHCSKCNRCIKKMDHHCFWLGSCINNDNLAHFIRFMFFAIVSITLLILYMSYITIENMKVDTKNFCYYRKISVLTATISYAIFVDLMLALFIFKYIKYILRNITFIELELCQNMIRCGKEPGPNPYDKGYWLNFKEIMGEPKFLFLFGENGDGMSFKKNSVSDCWPHFSKTETVKHGKVLDMNVV